jgi:pimeloyl-ACP methyl ester carboxylesterase
MGTVQSKDGTTIAYEVRGVGRPVILVDGATAYPAVSPETVALAEALSDSFRVYTYDRRGRGDSTNTLPYAVERELEDLAALVAEAGEPAVLFGWSSGAILAMDAAAAGLPVTHLVAFEPPFVVDDGRPPLPGDYVERLEAACDAGRPGDAVELFMTAAVGMPAEMVGGMRQSEFWPVLEAIAPTIAYDGRIVRDVMQGRPLPADRWAAISVPTAVVHGIDTFPFLVSGARAAADRLPTATLQPVPGENHSASADVLAPVIRQLTQDH